MKTASGMGRFRKVIKRLKNDAEPVTAADRFQRRLTFTLAIKRIH